MAKVAKKKKASTSSKTKKTSKKKPIKKAAGKKTSKKKAVEKKPAKKVSKPKKKAPSKPTKKVKKKAPPKKKPAPKKTLKKKAVKKAVTPKPKKTIQKAKPKPTKPTVAPKPKTEKTVKPVSKTAAPKKKVKVAPKKKVVAAPKKPTFKPRFSPEDLQAIKVRLGGMLTDHRDEIKHEVSSAADRDLDHISDSLDIATDSAEGDLNFRLAESGVVEAAEIIRAIEKVDEGTYGYCDMSFKAIPMERLRFLPWATRLVEFQEQYELRRKMIETGELDEQDELMHGVDLSTLS